MSASVAVAIVMVLWGAIPLLDKAGLTGEKVDPMAGLCIRLIAAVLVVVPAVVLSPAVKSSLQTVSLRGGLIIGASGIISLIISQYFYYTALQTADVSKLFTVLFCGTPVVTMLGGWILFRESASTPQIFGCLLLISGTYLILK